MAWFRYHDKYDAAAARWEKITFSSFCLRLLFIHIPSPFRRQSYPSKECFLNCYKQVYRHLSQVGVILRCCRRIFISTGPGIRMTSCFLNSLQSFNVAEARVAINPIIHLILTIIFSSLYSYYHDLEFFLFLCESKIMII